MLANKNEVTKSKRTVRRSIYLSIKLASHRRNADDASVWIESSRGDLTSENTSSALARAKPLEGIIYRRHSFFSALLAQI